MKKVTLEKIIADYKDDPSVETMEPVFEQFWIMAKKIVNHFIDKKLKWTCFDDKEKLARQMVCHAFLRIPRYDPQKGKAFNYFTTTMLGWLRQVCRTQYKYQELKEKYLGYVKKGSNSKN